MSLDLSLSGLSDRPSLLSRALEHGNTARIEIVIDASFGYFLNFLHERHKPAMKIIGETRPPDGFRLLAIYFRESLSRSPTLGTFLWRRVAIMNKAAYATSPQLHVCTLHLSDVGLKQHHQ
jgi:hypothetical protein